MRCVSYKVLISYGGQVLSHLFPQRTGRESELSAEEERFQTTF